MPTKIEWTDETWPVATGCSPVSPGCRNCYAARMAATRLKHHPRYEGLAYIGIASGRPRWTGEIRLNHDVLEQPLRWRKPRMIFVCSMGDLFHEAVPWEFILQVYKTIKRTPQHTYQILTKRPKRMLALQPHVWGELPNAWLGVSVENPDYLWRVEELLQIPAAVRFVSLEPLLGPMNIEWALQGWHEESSQYPDQYGRGPYPIRVQNAALSWVICGAESGSGRRLFEVAWALDLYEQCQRAGVPFFGKQDSGLYPGVPLLLGGREVKEWPL